MSTQIKPQNDYVFVMLDVMEDTTKGGIVLPKDAREQATTGTVAVSASNTVGVADRVLINRYAGHTATIDDFEYRIVKGEDIIAILS